MPCAPRARPLSPLLRLLPLLRASDLLDGGSLDEASQPADPYWVEERWLTTSEVAAVLGVSVDTVRRYIRERRLRSFALVKGERTVYRVRRADLLVFRATYVRDTMSDDWER